MSFSIQLTNSRQNPFNQPSPQILFRFLTPRPSIRPRSCRSPNSNYFRRKCHLDHGSAVLSDFVLLHAIVRPLYRAVPLFAALPVAVLFFPDCVHVLFFCALLLCKKLVFFKSKVIWM